MQISSYWTLVKLLNWRNYDATWTQVKSIQHDFLNASQLSFIGFLIRHLQRLLYPFNIFLESKNQQISKKRFITNWFTMHCKGFLVHFLPKCSLSDKSDRYRTFSAHLVDIRPTMHRETMECQPTWYEIFLPDFQAVTRKLKKKFVPNLDFWMPSPHLWIIKRNQPRRGSSDDGSPSLSCP